MTCRHLNIDFLENGDVEYHFFRHHSEYTLYRYEIDWPANQVHINGGQCLNEHNFRRSTLSNGHLLLEWDKIPEKETQLGRGINYIKQHFLKPVPAEPHLWQYQEDITIKPDFWFYLHSPNKRINAIKNRSTATFVSTSGQILSYKPRELTERRFRTAGILKIRWVLETLDTAKTHWNR